MPSMKLSLVKPGNFYSSLTGGLIPYVLCINYMSAFIDAYTEYLERMYDESDDLTLVDKFTVPNDVDTDSPALTEWADLG